MLSRISIFLITLIHLCQGQAQEQVTRLPSGVLASLAGNFSNRQGFNGWEYGFCEDTPTFDYKRDFQRFPTFGIWRPSHDLRYSLSPDDWLHVRSTGMHPSGAFGGSQLENPKAAVIRWTATQSCRVQIVAEFSKPAPGGDGVTIEIRIDGGVEESFLLEPQDSRTWDREWDISKGNVFDFIARANETSSGDGVNVNIRFLCEVPTADGFDYPIGDNGYRGKYLYELPENFKDSTPGQFHGDNNELKRALRESENLLPSIKNPTILRDGQGSAGEWFNANDTYNYYDTPKGFHPGEDWNRAGSTEFPGTNNEKGVEVRTIAPGKVIAAFAFNNSETEQLSSLRGDGYILVVRHWVESFLSPGTYSIYDSLYLHTCPDLKSFAENSEGEFGPDTKFSYPVGSILLRGEDGRLPVIARLGDITKWKNHLHLELRKGATSPDRSDPMGSLWPSAGSGVYYKELNAENQVVGRSLTYGSLSEDELRRIAGEVIQRMRDDGILDPSDFIDANRSLGRRTPFFTGYQKKRARLVSKVDRLKEKKRRAEAKKKRRFAADIRKLRMRIRILDSGLA